MSERRINAAVPLELAQFWASVVKDAGGEDEAVRRLLIMARARALRPPPRRPTTPQPVILTFKVAKADAAAAERVAAKAGFRRGEWIRALMVARLHAAPQFPKDELRLHAAIRYELQRIGSVLRAAAQRMESEGRQQQIAELIEAYGDARRQLAALRSAMAGSLLYWVGGDD